ncbi:MAG: DUF2207 domain-containing protein, partial [Micrococcales bacterium]|nr:DUF2207 domain-containing protein [Micrococcales bacterium]
MAPTRGRRRAAGAVLGLVLAVLTAGPAVATAPVPVTEGPRVGAWGGRAPSGLAAAEQADSLHTSIEAQPDGSVVVTEDVVWRFPEGEDRHGIYRLVRVRAGYRDSETQYRYYELSGIEVTSPSGAPTDITVEDYGADRRIRIGSPSETVRGTAHYVVRYRLAHLVNDIGDGTAEVYYDVVTTASSFPQHDVRASVSGPAAVARAACFSGPYGSTRSCPATPGPTATYTVPDLAAQEGASVVASFPRDAFGDLTPDLRTGDVGSSEGSSVSPATARALGLIAIGGGLLVPLTAASLMGLLVWTRGRDEQYAGLTPGLSPGLGTEQPVVYGGPAPTVAVRFTPPDGVQPGLVGTVLDEEAGLVDVTATIVDLAVRGYLRISRDDSGRFRRDDWVLTRTTPAAGASGLTPYEQLLYDALFAAGDTVTLSSLKNHFKPTLDSVQRLMYEEVVERGWFRRSPEAQRSGWMSLGIVLVGLGVLAGFFLAGSASGLFADSGLPVNPVWVLAGGLVVGGLVTRSLGKRMAARTAEGSAVLAQAKGFERYLATAEAIQIRWEEAQDLFSRFLPYAIVFGIADRWAEVFEQVAAAASAAG